MSVLEIRCSAFILHLSISEAVFGGSEHNLYLLKKMYLKGWLK